MDAVPCHPEGGLLVPLYPSLRALLLLHAIKLAWSGMVDESQIKLGTVTYLP